jgi:acyl homoserine lactone synthase
MQSTTISFGNMHTHGELFANLLRARRKSFILQKKWDLHEADEMEYDQYDTPASRWIAVHKDGEILAGIRLTPTTARCGIYSYMIRDAQKGLLASIPSNLLSFEAPVSLDVWESSRVFVAQSVPSNLRIQVQASLMQEMITAARELGTKQVLGLVPGVWLRWARRLGLDAEAAGPKMEIEGSSNQVALMHLLKVRH